MSFTFVSMKGFDRWFVYFMGDTMTTMMMRFTSSFAPFVTLFSSKNAIDTFIGRDDIVMTVNATHHEVRKKYFRLW